MSTYEYNPLNPGIIDTSITVNSSIYNPESSPYLYNNEIEEDNSIPYSKDTIINDRIAKDSINKNAI